jgi:hypothetical protein
LSLSVTGDQFDRTVNTRRTKWQIEIGGETRNVIVAMKTSVPDIASTLTNAVTTAGMARTMAFPAGTDARVRLVSIGAGPAVITAAENTVRVMARAGAQVSRLGGMARKDMARTAEPTAVRATGTAEADPVMGAKDMAVPGMAEEVEMKSGAGGSAPPMRFHLGLGTKRRSAGASWTTSERVGIAVVAPRVTPVRMIASGKRYAIVSLTIQWSMPQMLK